MTPDDRFTQLLDDLKMMGVTQNPFFGRRGLVADGKVIACFLDDSVAFKLGRSTEALSRALELSGADLWYPGNKIVPFKDWVRVPDTHQDEWGRLAEQALHHIRETL
ncbi:MAG TPA: hypothetical protein VGF80_06415 [Galbitalea sp.]|jgi:hypothetical protein